MEYVGGYWERRLRNKLGRRIKNVGKSKRDKKETGINKCIKYCTLEPEKINFNIRTGWNAIVLIISNKLFPK